MKKPPKLRADRLLVEQGLAEDEAAAQALIMAGRVLSTDPEGREEKVDKPGTPLRAWCALRIKGKARPYVSRAGQKLAGALDDFGVDPGGLVCADIGLSTGGFTDCLLRRGARRVHGVDVAYGVVDWRIRTDPRVVLYERTNARHLPPDFFGEPIDLAVVDVSFISVTAILPSLCANMNDPSRLLVLVKPQFEAAREDAPEGVVQDDAVRARAADRVAEAARAAGFRERARADSVLAGADGNREILLLATRG